MGAARPEVLRRACHALLRMNFDLRYSDSSYFALDENAGAIAEAIIETFSLDVCKAQIFPSGETIPTPED